MKKGFLLILIFFLFNCKKNKEQEFNDPEWRKESLEISYNICVKLESCISEDLSKIKKSLHSYTKSELVPQKCSEKNKKSRVYLLRGSDPLKIKQVTKECYSHIQKLSCEEIRSGSIMTNNSCEEMRKIQQGLALDTTSHK